MSMNSCCNPVVRCVETVLEINVFALRELRGDTHLPAIVRGQISESVIAYIKTHKVGFSLKQQ